MRHRIVLTYQALAEGKTTDDVLDATDRKQQPFTYGSLPGRIDFYFKPPKAGPAAPPAET